MREIADAEPESIMSRDFSLFFYVDCLRARAAQRCNLCRQFLGKWEVLQKSFDLVSDTIAQYLGDNLKSFEPIAAQHAPEFSQGLGSASCAFGESRESCS